MTTGLERRAHRLVELARPADDPSAAQLLSLHAAVAAAIAAEGAIAASGTAAAGSTKVASVTALMKGLMAAGAIATGAVGFYALRESPPAQPPAALQARLALPPALPSPAAAPEAGAAPHVASAAAVESAPEVTPPPSRGVKQPSGLRLEDEAALLAEVQGALRSGHARMALTKLESYDRRFPGGMLRAEADAARVFAWCAAGSVEKARAAATRFAQRYPSSPAAARVQAACK